MPATHKPSPLIVYSDQPWSSAPIGSFRSWRVSASQIRGGAAQEEVRRRRPFGVKCITFIWIGAGVINSEISLVLRNSQMATRRPSSKAINKRRPSGVNRRKSTESLNRWKVVSQCPVEALSKCTVLSSQATATQSPDLDLSMRRMLLETGRVGGTR